MSDLHDNEKSEALVLSYLGLRRGVGLLGCALPIAVSLVAYMLADLGIRDSISSYYHTPARDVFVGALCAVALFLFSYKGYDRSDNIAGNWAALCALGIAFFPTTPPGDTASARQVIIGKAHLAFAGLFFLTLTYYSVRLFTLSKGIRSKEKQKRDRIYRWCGGTMGGCVVLIAAYNIVLEKWFPGLAQFHPVYWLEFVALWAFGFSWLTKGQVIWKDVEEGVSS